MQCFLEEHKFDDPTSTATIHGGNVAAFLTRREQGNHNTGSLSFLPPNRFDVGYEKYNHGHVVGFEATGTLRRLESFDDGDSGMMDMND